MPGARRFRRAGSECVPALPCLLVLALVFSQTHGHAAAQGGSGTPGPAEGQPRIAWIVGPAVGELGTVATLNIPDGYVFAGPSDTRKIMESMQNLTDGSEMGFIAPVESDWFIVFEYQGVGYVRDDDGDLDAEEILASLRRGNAEANRQRREKGWETLEILGWARAPHYSVETNNLEWATRLRSSDGPENVNYNSRLLGRHGVMSATLVCGEEEVVENMAAFREILAGHRYVPGGRYAEFRPGDKVAAYGLTALITGGAAAVAIKSGLFKKLWKLIVLAVAGGAAVLRRLFMKSPPAEEVG